MFTFCVKRRSLHEIKTDVDFTMHQYNAVIVRPKNAEFIGCTKNWSCVKQNLSRNKILFCLNIRKVVFLGLSFSSSTWMQWSFSCSENTKSVRKKDFACFFISTVFAQNNYIVWTSRIRNHNIILFAFTCILASAHRLPVLYNTTW